MALSTLGVKIIVGILIFILSAVFGCLPMILSMFCGLEADHPPTRTTKKKLKNVVLAFLLNFGGGVLSANAFCHWLPELVEEWETLEIESKLPLPFVITLAGFFFVCIMEEVLHHFLQPHEPTTDCDTFMDTHPEVKEEGKLQSFVNSTLKRKPLPSPTAPRYNQKGIHLDEFSRYDRRNRDESQDRSQDSHPPSYTSQSSADEERPYESNVRRGSNGQIATFPENYERRMPERRMSERRTSERKMSQRKMSVIFDSMVSDFPSNVPRRERRVSKILSGDGTEAGLQTTSAIRTFFVVAALSFHSVIEGMTLGLEEDSEGVWMSFLAISLHKFVIAFSVGVELLAAETRKMNYFISMGVFSTAPVIGVTIGILLTEVFGKDEVNQVAIQSIQGIACGTIIYVVFFEVFPKGKEIGGTGFQHVIAMTAGFLCFLPTLLVHHEHGDEEEATSSTTVSTVAMLNNLMTSIPTKLSG